MNFYKSEWLDDWYVLDNATHFGIPEGSKAEWDAVVKAIRSGESASFKRVAARKRGEMYAISSPRNACSDSDRLDLHETRVDEFCAMVEAVLNAE